MPLSEEAKKSLSESEEINKQKQRQAQQEEQQRQQLEQQYNQYVQQEAELQRQLAQAQSQEQQKTIQQRLSQIAQPFEDQIAQKIREKQQAINAVPFEGNRSKQREKQQAIERNYNRVIDRLSREKTTALNYAEFSIRYPDQQVSGSIQRTFLKSGGQASLSSLYEKQQQAREAKLEYDKRSSAKQAQSDVIKSREQLEKQIREFESEKTKYGTQQSATILQNQDKLITATKRKPRIYDSSYFRGEETSAIPKDIKGTSEQKSKEAIKTFDQIEAEQKKLFESATLSKSSSEAIEQRQKARQENPYVGTANLLYKKGELKEQFGVLVEKRLEEKFDTKSISSDVANLKESSVETFNPISDPKQELTETTVNTPEEIPKYIFIDEQGKEKQLSDQELFSYVSYLSGQNVPLPSRIDQQLNKYIRENQDAVIEAEKIDIKETVPLQKDTLLEPLTDYAGELHYGTTNLFKPEDQQTKYPESLEGVATSDIMTFGKSSLQDDYEKYVSGEPEYKTVPWLEEKIKTEQGLQYVAVSALATGAFWWATASKAPALALAKHGNLISKQTMKLVAPIVERLKQTKESLQAQELIKKFPDLPPGLKEELITKNENIVGVEMLDPKTVLIIRGTEGSEPLTPYIIVKNTGKKSRYGKLYQTYDHVKPGAYREIIVSGVQKSELEKGKVISKDIVSYPATRQNIMTVEQTDKLARVGSSEKVGLEGLQQTPKAVIEKIETQQVKTGTILTETERLNPKKSLNEQVKGFEPDSLSKKTSDTQTKSKTSLDDSIKEAIKETDKIELPPSKGTQTITTDPLKARKDELKKLKDTIKQTETQTAKSSGVTVVESSAIFATTAIRSSLRQSQDAINLNLQGIKSSQAMIHDQQARIKTDLETKSDITQRTSDIIKIELEKIQQTKPTISPKYSLIVDSGLQEKTDIVPRFKLITTQKTTHIPPDVPAPEKSKTTTPKPPNLSLDISLDLKDESKQIAGKKRTGKIGYWRWNVNTQSVGQYLPTKDLSTGKTSKVIEAVDRLERKINQPNYYKKLYKKEQKFFKLNMKDSNQSLIKKSNITQISKPQGKQAKKFLKKFKVNLGF